MEPAGLTCRELIEFLLDYEDGVLPEATRRVFEAHVEACPPCRDYLDSYRATIELASDACAAGDAVPEEVPEELVRAVLAARAGRR